MLLLNPQLGLQRYEIATVAMVIRIAGSPEVAVFSLLLTPLQNYGLAR
ncbi:MAG TPA: hypothetical protein VF503_15345 [Sphingobium sp.]